MLKLSYHSPLLHPNLSSTYQSKTPLCTRTPYKKLESYIQYCKYSRSSPGVHPPPLTFSIFVSILYLTYAKIFDPSLYTPSHPSSESTPTSALDHPRLSISINIMPRCKSCASCIAVTAFRKINCDRKNVKRVKSFENSHICEHPIAPTKKRRTTAMDALPSGGYDNITRTGSSHDHPTPHAENNSHARAA